MKPRSHSGALLRRLCFAEPHVSWQDFRSCVWGVTGGKRAGTQGRFCRRCNAGGGRKSNVYFNVNKLSSGDVCER